MPEALYALALLACPVGMGLMMWFMMRGGKHPRPEAPPERSAQLSASDAAVAALRAEVDQLRAEQRDSHRPGEAGAPPADTQPR